MEPARKRARSDSGESATSGGKDTEEAPTSPIVTSKPSLEVPDRIWDELSASQRKGVRWLWRRHCESRGGILADDVGAGKTAQIVGYAAGLHHAGLLAGRRGAEAGKPSAARPPGKLGMLVVCPPLRVPKWHTEFVLRCPALCVHKAALVADGSAAISAALRDSGVLILSYEAMLSAQGELSSSTEVMVVDDDGRGFRHPHSELAQAAKRFSTPRRLVVARAPVERLEELWSLVDLSRPGSLGCLPVFAAQLAGPVEAAAPGAGTAARALAAGCASALRNMTVQGILCRAAQGPGDFGAKPREPGRYLAFVRPLQPHLQEGNELQREDVEAQQLELKRMLRAMMQSIEDCAEYDLGTPTWTGRVGAAGVPPPAPRSAEAERILRDRLEKAMEQFASLPEAAGLQRRGAQSQSAEVVKLPPEAEGIAADILRTFLELDAGPEHKLTTDQVIRTLALAVPPESKELFRGLLQHLCIFSKGERETDPSTWSLKRNLWPMPGAGREEVEHVLRIRLASALQEFASHRAAAQAASASDKQQAEDQQQPASRSPLVEKGQCQGGGEVKEKAWKAASDVEGLAESILRTFWDEWAGPEHWLTTEQVLWRLAPTVPPESKRLFKGLLHHFCTLSKAENEGEQSAWLLKREFWPNARRGDLAVGARQCDQGEG